jgi:hypothetical protein
MLTLKSTRKICYKTKGRLDEAYTINTQMALALLARHEVTQEGR